jgi:hypothetical protein
MGVAGLIATIIDKEKPACVYIDSTGLGVGVTDRLAERGYDEVVPVNFATRSTETPVVNEAVASKPSRRIDGTRYMATCARASKGNSSCRIRNSFIRN